MNAAIELHDSDLTAIVHDGASIVLSFSPAYIHLSEGQPGVDASSGWLQTAEFTFANAAISSAAELPCTVWDGELSVNGDPHMNLVPAAGVFETPCELRLTLQNSALPLVVRGTRLNIALHGEPAYVEEFSR